MNTADSTSSRPIRASEKLSITAGVIRRIEPADKPFSLRDTVVPGLVLIVRPTGSKNWYLDYRLHGKRKSYRIGSIADFTSNEARKLAKQLKAYISTGTDPAAERAEAKVEAQQVAREAQDAVRRTVTAYLSKSYAPDHLDHIRGGRATERDLKAAFPKLLKRDMASLTVDEMKRWANKRISEGIKPATVNRQRTMLMALLNHAVENGVLAANPLAKWKRLKVEDKSRVRYLGSNDSHERFKKGERERFLEALDKMPTDIQAIIRTAMLTGMRRGEIFNLRWSDVDLKTGIITVQTSKSGRSRSIPISSTLDQVLRSWRGDVIQLDRDALLFPSPRTGGRRSDIKKPWTKLVEMAKLEDFHFHDLRHDSASRMVQAGVPVAEVSKILGHSSIQITEQVYAHLAPEHLRNAMEVLS